MGTVSATSVALTETDQWVTTPEGYGPSEPLLSAIQRKFLENVNDRAYWLYNRLAARVLGTHHVIESVDDSADTITITGHGLSNGDTVRIESVGGSVPGGLAADTVYYVSNVTTDTLKLKNTAGAGITLNITSAGSGTLYLYEVPDVFAALVSGPDLVVGTYTMPKGFSLKDVMAYVASTLGTTFTGAVAVSSAGSFTLQGTNRVLYASRSLTRVQKAPLINVTLDTASDAGLSVQKGDAATQALAFPNGATLTAFSVYHNRTNTGSLPATRLQVGIKKVAIATGTASDVVALTEDPEAVLASYEAHHAIAITGLSEVIDNTAYRYYLNILGETDPNGATTTVYPCITTVTMTSDDEHP